MFCNSILHGVDRTGDISEAIWEPLSARGTKPPSGVVSLDRPVVVSYMVLLP